DINLQQWIRTNIKLRPDVVKNKRPHIYDQIVQTTSYLSNTSRLRQRYHHIINNTNKIPLCPVCNKELKWDEQKRDYTQYCSKRCVTSSNARKETIKQTCLKKYGGIAPACNEQVQSKRKKTNLEKYGTENFSELEAVKDKRRKTNIEKYGVNNPTKNKEIAKKVSEKMIITNKLYGNEIREKTKQTCLEKYGVENPALVEEFQIKKKITSLKKYGVNNYNNSKKSRQTNIEKYGVIAYKQLHMKDILPLLQDKNWLFNQYINLNKTAAQIANELGTIWYGTVIGYLKKAEIEIKYKYNYSSKQIQWLESIIQQEGIYIQHAGNEGEYLIPGTRFKADGYCSETNTIYEFHGDYWHGNPDVYSSDEINKVNGKTMGELYQKTLEKEETIKGLGYNLVVAWENELNF
ncbi:MAG: DUF7487 domain-containing protein, partial [Flavisolibacter sp.]